MRSAVTLTSACSAACVANRTERQASARRERFGRTPKASRFPRRAGSGFVGIGWGTFASARGIGAERHEIGNDIVELRGREDSTIRRHRRDAPILVELR